MHPAISVICFTLFSGAGYGLISFLCLDDMFDLNFTLSGSGRVWLVGVALVLITVGLLASTLHLANPRNAWRAFFRFRTSWLSREGVFAVLLYPVALFWLLTLWSSDAGGSKILAALTFCLAIATLFSTGMIYACLKTIRQWNTALTPTNYILLGFMLGSLILVASGAGNVTIAVGMVGAAALGKLIYYYWIGQPAGPTINSALGFTRATVRLLDVGHGEGNFLTDEFGYEVAKAKLIWLRVISIVFGFLMPVALLLIFGASAGIPAMVSGFSGVFVERWLFFAEARHVVNLYHGSQST